MEVGKPPRQREPEAIRRQKRKELDARRSKCRIRIGNHLEQWCIIKEKLGFSLHSDFAKFLLDSYSSKVCLTCEGKCSVAENSNIFLASGDALRQLVVWAHDHSQECGFIPNLKCVLTGRKEDSRTVVWECLTGHAFSWCTLPLADEGAANEAQAEVSSSPPHLSCPAVVAEASLPDPPPPRGPKRRGRKRKVVSPEPEALSQEPGDVSGMAVGLEEEAGAAKGEEMEPEQGRTRPATAELAGFSRTQRCCRPPKKEDLIQSAAKDVGQPEVEKSCAWQVANPSPTPSSQSCMREPSRADGQEEDGQGDLYMVYELGPTLETDGGAQRERNEEVLLIEDTEANPLLILEEEVNEDLGTEQDTVVVTGGDVKEEEEEGFTEEDIAYVDDLKDENYVPSSGGELEKQRRKSVAVRASGRLSKGRSKRKEKTHSGKAVRIRAGRTRSRRVKSEDEEIAQIGPKRIRKAAKKEILLCDFDGCGKIFSNRQYLNHHMKYQHVQQRTFACSYPTCGKSFNFKKHLKEHEKLHSGVRSVASPAGRRPP
ncbi:zinc finger protein 692 isoform X2 [Latimeria chalumnae]|uniref:zinc finger protein 692 isoform X2 n=1 Tax=Latimeria chalumnae TaxID=7897 RepID=UPI00313B7AA0